MAQNDSQQWSIDRLKLNESNPRSISDDKFQKLITSILTFPRMLELRPIIVDEEDIVLGGNMRTLALQKISEMGFDGAISHIKKQPAYKECNEFEKHKLYKLWKKWFQNPFAYVEVAEGLTEDEKREFIVKDNVAFGKWDWDALANEWDAEELTEWGVDLPIMESEINTDEFFDSLDNDDEKSKSEKIVISIPEDMKDLKEEMKALVEDALKEYSGIKVK